MIVQKKVWGAKRGKQQWKFLRGQLSCDRGRTVSYSCLPPQYPEWWVKNEEWGWDEVGVEPAANPIFLSACRSCLGKQEALMWCAQWAETFHSRRSLCDASARPPSARPARLVEGVTAAFSCAYHVTKNEGELLFTSCPGVPGHAVPQPGPQHWAEEPPATLVPRAPREGQGGPGAAALQERLGLEPVLRDRGVHRAGPRARGQGKAAVVPEWFLFLLPKRRVWLRKSRRETPVVWPPTQNPKVILPACLYLIHRCIHVENTCFPLNIKPL